MTPSPRERSQAAQERVWVADAAHVHSFSLTSCSTSLQWADPIKHSALRRIAAPPEYASEHGLAEKTARNYIALAKVNAHGRVGGLPAERRVTLTGAAFS